MILSNKKKKKLAIVDLCMQQSKVTFTQFNGCASMCINAVSIVNCQHMTMQR